VPRTPTAQDRNRSERGQLRITAPHNLGLTFLVGLIHRFRDRYPEIKIDLALDDAVVNLIDDQVDIAIRVGPLRDSSNCVVRLCSYELIMCASKLFPKKQLPMEPAELVDLPWIEVPRQSIGHRLKLVRADGARKTVQIYPSVTTNSGLAAQALIRMGDGIGILPNYAVLPDFKAGNLVRVLPSCGLPPGSISAVFPSTQLPHRARLFLDFAKVEFKSAFKRASAE
jgi:DNA-binding transcriptional LysR family regulator